MSIVSVSPHCIRHKVQFTTHKNSSQLRCYTERNKIWSPHFLLSLEALCTYYLSEWQMFFKWWCLMWAELLPKLHRERLPDVTRHLMVKTSTGQAPPRCRAPFREALKPEAEVVRVVETPRPATASPDTASGSKGRMKISCLISGSRAFRGCFGGCNKYFLLQQWHKY